MSIKKEELAAALAQIEAEWKAFQVLHKMQPRPFAVRTEKNYPVVATIHSVSYAQGKLWSKSDHNSNSQRLNDLDSRKP